MTAPDLSRELFGHTFQNPILLAAGTAGYGRELDGVMDLDRLGGIVTKAVSLAPRAGNRAPRVAEFPGGMLNSVGLANPGLAEVRARELPWLIGRLHRARIVVNIVGFTETEYAEVIAGLEDLEGIAGWELNLSCPNTKAGGIEFGADPASVARIVSGCRAITRRGLIAKLSPVLPDIPAIAAAAVEAGADGISVVNTIPGSLTRDGLPRLGNGSGGVSGPALLPVGLLAVQRVKARLPDVPVIGVGGVRSAGDVRQYLGAGASLVAIGTAQLADPRVPQRIVEELMTHG
ncbi:MAG TPA: dihydroorotate dehydrogenase [Gemmatimonadales bacterium]|nr:dihydroorotate dehydrogenase [Gemmatimonadales bacterium]